MNFNWWMTGCVFCRIQNLAEDLRVPLTSVSVPVLEGGFAFLISYRCALSRRPPNLLKGEQKKGWMGVLFNGRKIFLEGT